MLPALLALVACHHAVVDDTDTDTDVADTDVPVLGVAPLFDALHSPTGWWRWAHDTVLEGSSCPSVTKDDDTHWRLVGGCTDGDGRTWQGYASWLDSDAGQRVGFNALVVTEADGTSLQYDGEVVVNKAGELTANFTARDAGGAIVFAWSNLTVSSVAGFEAAWLHSGAGSFESAGQFTAATRGIFTVAEHVDHEGQCDQEPDGGELDLTGPETLTFTYNGSALCDGCLQYRDATGLHDDLCPWR